jgi:uncharacterized membrane protein YdbT with pleckstrin-like domain
MKEELPFNLQKGERLVEDIIPDRRGFVLSRVINGLFPSGIMSLVLGVYAAIGISAAKLNLWIGVVALILFFITIVAVNWAVALVAYGKFRYWVTNYRVVGRRGVIGYSIDSIPLENITDVIIGRGIAERILGLSSLRIVPIGGAQIAYGRYGGISSTNYFPALMPKHARELQEKIFELRNKRKKEAGRIL